MSVPQLSILIISHGHNDCLPECLASLSRALVGMAAELLLLDNLGGDLRESVPNFPCPVRHFANNAPAGFAANANQLTREARAPWVLLLNPDTAYVEGRLQDLLVWLAAQPHTGLAGCRLLNKDGSIQPSCRRFPTLPALLIRGLGGDRWPWRPAFYRWRMMEGDVPQVLTTVDWVFGAFLLYRRDEYLALGGMDEGFRLYYEDVDLAWRYQEAGLATAYFPALSFKHSHLRSSARRPLGRVWCWHLQSAWRFFRKHGFFVNARQTAPLIRT